MMLASNEKDKELLTSSFLNLNEVKMKLPLKIGDFTDFYSSKNHAFNLGSILRGPENALQPNWVHLPVGYSGRSSTVIVSPSNVVRPSGQITTNQKDSQFSECKKLDFELEMGAVIGKSNNIGQPVKIKEASTYVFGYVLLNDWSARDIQAWEYVPLGPFTAKNFATTISPWIVTVEALEPFRVKLPEQNPKPLKYLYMDNLTSFDINLEILLKSKNDKDYSLISKSNYKYMYWTVEQQIAHHSITGCSLNVGDLFGSGTISGTEKETYGCLFEITSNGKNPFALSNSTEKTNKIWLENHDSVKFNGYCNGNGYKVGFGDLEGTVLPALTDDYFN